MSTNSTSHSTNEKVYNDNYDILTINLKSYVDSFKSKHDKMTFAELVKEYETCPLSNIPDLIKCAKYINYDMMYKVHIELLANCLDTAPGLFKGIMEGHSF